MADVTDPLKIAGIFLTNIAVPIPFYISISKNEIPSPLAVSSAFISLITIITCYFLYQSGDYFYIFILIIMNLFSYSMIFRLVKKRDGRGVHYGEVTLEYLSGLDKQLCSILNGIIKDKDSEELKNYIKNSLDVVITQISNLLDLNINHESHISIYKTLEDGKFRIVHSRSVQPEHIHEIERKFNYKKPFGLAGYAVYEGKTIYIPNLSDTQDPNFEKWQAAYEGQAHSGSIICIPISRGLKGENEFSPLGVFCLTSMKTKAFDKPTVRSLIKRFTNRVEILLYCLELVENKERKPRQKE